MNGKYWLSRIAILMGVLAIGVTAGCPIYRIFGISCPCCGITRAWISLLNGDMGGAIAYNPIFFPITLTLMIFLFEDKIFKRQKTKNIFFGLTGGVIFLSYLVRLWQGTLPI